MAKFKTLLPFLVLLAIAVPVVVWLYPLADPYGGIHTGMDAQEAVKRSGNILDSLGVSHVGLTPAVEFRVNNALVRQLQNELGISASDDRIREGIPAYFWNIRWRNEKSFSLVSGGSNAENLLEQLKGEVQVRLTQNGALLGFDRKIADSVAMPTRSQEEARAAAVTLMKEFGFVPPGMDASRPGSEKAVPKPNRVDYEFSWDAKFPELPNIVRVTVVLAGGIPSRLETNLNVPATFEKAPLESAAQIAIVILSAVFIVIMIVLAFRRFRSFEIGFRLAVTIGIVVAVVVGLEIFLGNKGDMGWEILLPLLLGPLFIGGALVLVWSVGESIARETWNEKLVTLDLVSNGHIFHSRVGGSVLRGISAGFVSVAVWYALILLAGTWVPVWSTHSDESAIRMFEVSMSSLIVMAHNFYTSIYFFALFVLFGVSFARRHVGSPVLLVIVMSLVLGVMKQGNVFPLPAGIVIHAIVAVVIVWTFYRYDALAAFLALFTISVVQDSGALWASGHPTYQSAGMLGAVLFGIAVVGSVAAQFRKKEITEFETIAPPFARHITERQRLQQELEIARQVQMSFLPKSDPKVAGLDIASRCVPALEVGGDYYDFIHLGPRKLGIAIGDVSGKGTQAAFYMTLAKGFLRALSDPTTPVSTVLKQMNRLFYENVERGSFISMVYGMFDLGKKAFHLTRAGHNPVLVWKAKAQKLEVIQPNGLALGLEDGRKFSRTIQEVRIPFARGDWFVFYTDGFTEAMNKNQEEFGDERFAKTVQNYVDGTATAMVDGVLHDTRVFMGKAQQHDDMTLVVVKVH